MKIQRRLGTLALVFIMYFNTSGGPFTTEALVSEVGPGLALLLLLAIPVLWAIPETLIVAELASMMPVEGGYYRWVQRAFGDRWAFQNGWITWMYSLVDMALYPLLFIQYLRFFVPALSESIQWLVALAVIWGATAINLRGAGRVGATSIAAGFFVIGTFLVLALASLPNAAHSPLTPFTVPGETPMRGLALGLSLALWNYIGWDNASTVQGEVRDASRTYPRALAIALPLATLGCLLPLLATLAASDWRTWTDGGWPQIALASAGALGPTLAVLLAIGGMISALALFNALLLSYSRIPFVMATDGFLPPALGKTDARGTPRNAVLAAAAVYSVFVLLPFAHLLIADVLLYSLALMLEFGALIALRKREPELRGAFRIPVGRAGVIALAALPLAILLFVVGVSFYDGEYALPAVLGALVASASGFVAYGFVRGTRDERGGRRESGAGQE
jgi:amino acid transporter